MSPQVRVMLAGALVLVAPTVAGAAPWQHVPEVQLPDAGLVTQKLELADLNHDGWVDLVFANSAGDAAGGPQTAQLNQLLLNDGGAGFTELGGVFDEPDNAYAIKAGDLDGDGDADLVIGVNFGGPSYVLVHEGVHSFTRVDIAPSLGTSIGDLELGDLDGDGDLDILATDWGSAQPHDDPGDPGAPLHLWLGNGDGSFDDGDFQLPMGMESWAAWSFDVELVDLDNDAALDVLVSSRGPGFGFGLKNDGLGNFAKSTIPALASDAAKQVNSSFTPVDLDGDGFLDLVSLQDGVGASGNSILLNDGGNYPTDNSSDFWPLADNPPTLDFDAATLDFDNDGRPDFVVTGPRVDPGDNNSRLFLNQAGAAVAPAPAPLDAAFPIVPELAHTFGLMFADFDHDGREDAAVASRDADLPDFVLFGRDDANDGVPVDTTPPRIFAADGLADQLGPLLFFGQDARLVARVDDFKTPSRWHDYQFDVDLDTYNLIGAGALTTAHRRRLPYVEFALGLEEPDDILSLPDGDALKFISPSQWIGEALWRVGFTVPFAGTETDTLTWQVCAIDAAANKTCVGPFQAMLAVDPADCGNGTIEPWETCDDLENPLCVSCKNTCGNGVLEPNETVENCPEDSGTPCDHDGVCDPNEGAVNCPDDCGGDGVCGDGTCQHPHEDEDSCPRDCGPCDHDGACEPLESAQRCPDDCDYDGFCSDGIVQNPPENEENCPEDSGPEPTGGAICGNGVCDADETVASCPEDCAVCGDGTCNETEDADNCPRDCPVDECPDGAPAEDGACELEEEGESGCGCATTPRPLGATLLLLGLVSLGRSRRRPRG